ncbi:hypothetical protein LEP1GSC127_4876 [Leptospira kirschneri str. 200801925]|nr:hypothetical protein LEP1GSC127_4876 [Leptospira kirschneri str. 200801925]
MVRHKRRISFFSNPKVCYDKIIFPHRQSTKKRIQNKKQYWY